MSSVPATVEPIRRSVLIDMASRYGMEPAAFEATLRATVVPGNCSREHFAAFLLVAKEYGLNPILKEIYAFPGKGGGIQPIVSIDGWMNLINSHPQLDGLEFDDHAEAGGLTAITARIWRKDRAKPIVVTEYMAECKRDTDTWKKWPRRMLRHKAAIQCARYAFGFSGIADPDEAERAADVSPMRDRGEQPRSLTGRLDALASAPSAVEHAGPVIDGDAEQIDQETGEVLTNDAPADAPAVDTAASGPDESEAWRKTCVMFFDQARTPKAVENFYRTTVEPQKDGKFPDDVDGVEQAYNAARERLSP